jgi:hypothetical protein
MARIWFAPLTAVGRAIVCTKAPAGVYSSRNNAVAAEVSAADPSPTLLMTKSPGVMPAPKTVAEINRGRERVSSRFIYWLPNSIIRYRQKTSREPENGARKSLTILGVASTRFLQPGQPKNVGSCSIRLLTRTRLGGTPRRHQARLKLAIGSASSLGQAS